MSNELQETSSLTTAAPFAVVPAKPAHGVKRAERKNISSTLSSLDALSEMASARKKEKSVGKKGESERDGGNRKQTAQCQMPSSDINSLVAANNAASSAQTSQCGRIPPRRRTRRVAETGAADLIVALKC